MGRTTDRAIADYLIALGDDELILGHRDSQWCGHAPILEEDIAFANIALDEIGHARLWYQAAAELLGESPAEFPDRLVFFRPAKEFRCSQIVEQPNGDWAFSILRQFLFDSYEKFSLYSQTRSQVKVIAEVAGRIQTEEIYHLRHTEAWVTRLVQGTEESHKRTQAAWAKLLPFVQQLALSAIPGEYELMEFHGDPINPEERLTWLDETADFLGELGLEIRKADYQNLFARERTYHSDYLEPLVNEMQEVAQLDPEAKW